MITEHYVDLDNKARIDYTKDFFTGRGWKVEILDKDSGNLQSIDRSNAVTRCADDRYPKELCTGPAILGGADGVAAFVNSTDDIAERFRIGIKKIRRSGIDVGSHGDDTHGDDLGCRFRQAWINGEMPGFNLPPLTVLESRFFRMIHNIKHHRLTGPHDARSLIINFEPESTAIPNNCLVKDLWYLLSLDFPLDNVLALSARISEIILPEENRKLYIR